MVIITMNEFQSYATRALPQNQRLLQIVPPSKYKYNKELIWIYDKKINKLNVSTDVVKSDASSLENLVDKYNPSVNIMIKTPRNETFLYQNVAKVDWIKPNFPKRMIKSFLVAVGVLQKKSIKP